MKFWDTIAKMCGVEVQPRGSVTFIGRLAHTTIAPGCDVTIRGHKIALDYDSTSADAWLAVNGHGLRVRDRTAFRNGVDQAGLRFGLIDIERIRPMKGKCGSIDIGAMADIHKRATQYAEAVKANAPKEPSVLS